MSFQIGDEKPRRASMVFGSPRVRSALEAARAPGVARRHVSPACHTRAD